MLDTIAAGTRRRTGDRRCRQSVQLLLLSLSICLLGRVGVADDGSLGVKVPPEFEVTRFADDDLAHDIYSMTIDSLGRVVVSGAGYVKILVDADHDGKAESAVTYLDQIPQGAQGMAFLGRDLICTGPEGLVRYRDRNNDDRADGPPEVFLKIKTGEEHDLHAIRRGADGWWYLIAGNAAGVDEKFAALPTSPVKKPAAGAILRMKPDLSGGEVYADGFRNAYDFDFSSSGDLFAFDSDGEQVISLPWYRPTRLLNVLPGSHQGWISGNWIRPDNFFDMPPVTASMGRGSPTGVVCYQHTTFPASYHGALFVMDWTFGKVYALPLTKNGSTWKTEPVEFMTSVGQHGFAPTDIEVGPQGELYVCVGGRGTRGGVYCIRPRTKDPASRPWPGGAGMPTTVAESLNVCLTAPQPLSSWARRVWEPLAAKLRSEPFIKAAMDETRPSKERVRAIEILVEKFQGLDHDLSLQLTRSSDPAVRARAAWGLGRIRPQTPNAFAISAFLSDSDPHVVRAAMEALISADPSVVEEVAPAFGQQLAHADKYVRQTAMRVMSHLSGTSIHKLAQIGFRNGWSAAIPVAGAFAATTSGYAAYSVDIGLSILQGDYPPQLKLEAVRIMQLGLGDVAPAAGTVKPVYEGYAARQDLSKFEDQVSKLRNTLPEIYPVQIPAVDWELERVIAMVRPASPTLVDKILLQITHDSLPVDDIHRLIVVSRLQFTPTPEQRSRIADAVVRLELKIVRHQLKRDSDWDERIFEMYGTLVERDPELPLAVMKNPEFGLPGHVRFIGKLSHAQIEVAIQAFVQKIHADPGYAWNSDVIFLLGASSDPAVLGLVRSKFDDLALRGAVVTSLSADPQEQDRPLYLTCLESSSVDTILTCVEALLLLPPSRDAKENVLLARTLRKLGDRGEERQARDQLVELLRQNLKFDHGYILGRDGDPQSTAIAAWMTSVQTLFPAEFAAAQGAGEQSLSELYERLDKIAWQTGNAARGHQIFSTRGCVQCHGHNRAIGPPLDGVAGRFSRNDLFTAIVFPSRDVSPRYQATQILTVDGHVRTGMILYEAIDGLAIRDANNQTFRLDLKEIEARRLMTQSLMPDGLLKGLSDQDFADLYAYIQSLKLTSTASTAEGHRE